MADPEAAGTIYGYTGAEDNPIESEGIGPFGWLQGIEKAGTEAFFAYTLKELGQVVKGVVVDWAGEQVADKVVEGAEKAIDYKPPDIPPPSLPVDMGGPAMGVPLDPNAMPPDLKQGQDNTSPQWDPSGERGPSSAGGVMAEQTPSDETDEDNHPPSFDMGAPAMGVPYEPPTDTPNIPLEGDFVTLPPADSPNIVSPSWDPGSDASWFTAPTEMPPIPLAPPAESPSGDGL